MEIVVVIITFVILLFLTILADKYFSYRVELAEKQSEIKVNDKYMKELEEFKNWNGMRLDAIMKKISSLEELKSRVDTLTLKAGFKL